MKPMSHSGKQSGAVLIVALLFLVILTILGITAMTATTFEERMAGNTRDVGLAFQAAEAAMRDARRDINGIVISGTPQRSSPVIPAQFGDGSAAPEGTCGSGLYVGLCRPTAYVGSANAVLPAMPNHSMTGAPSVGYGTYTNAPAVAGVSNQPRYVVEIFCLPRHDSSLGDPTFCNFYRITARGYGRSANTQVTLQEVFLR
jgi:type IV pilus assembly protein PilX